MFGLKMAKWSWNCNVLALRGFLDSSEVKYTSNQPICSSEPCQGSAKMPLGASRVPMSAYYQDSVHNDVRMLVMPAMPFKTTQKWYRM